MGRTVSAKGVSFSWHYVVVNTLIGRFTGAVASVASAGAHFLSVRRSGAMRARLLRPTRYGTLPLLRGE